MRDPIVTRTNSSFLTKRTVRSAGLLLILGLATFLLIANSGNSASAPPVRDHSKKPDVSLQTVYYDIKGSTVRELKSQMYELGPVDKSGRHNDGFTDWDIRWTYTCKGQSGKISLDSFDVKLKVKFIYPRWKPSSNASKALVKKWETYLSALLTHEDRHKDMAIEAANEIVRRLKELGSYASCQELGMALNAAGDNVLEETREEESRYDDETDHGLTQGARLR